MRARAGEGRPDVQARSPFLLCRPVSRALFGGGWPGPVPAGCRRSGRALRGLSESVKTLYTQLYRVSRNNFLDNGCTGGPTRVAPCTWSHSCLQLRGVAGDHEEDPESSPLRSASSRPRPSGPRRRRTARVGARLAEREGRQRRDRRDVAHARGGGRRARPAGGGRVRVARRLRRRDRRRHRDRVPRAAHRAAGHERLDDARDHAAAAADVRHGGGAAARPGLRGLRARPRAGDLPRLVAASPTRRTWPASRTSTRARTCARPAPAPTAC